MDLMEDKYVMIKDKMKKLTSQLAEHRVVLNDTADVLLNGSNKYEMKNHDIVLHKPTTHKVTKK